jgi:hypothetical protein
VLQTVANDDGVSCQPISALPHRTDGTLPRPGFVDSQYIHVSKVKI